MAAGVATVAAVGYYAVSAAPLRVLVAIDLPFIWAYAASLTGLWLPLMIGLRATQRFFDPTQIDGSAPAASSPAQIDARVLQNTLEQTVLALLASGLVALSHATHAAMLITMHAATFFIARLCFWVGYHRAPWMRAYGFSLGFYGSVSMYIYALHFLLRAIT